MPYLVIAIDITKGRLQSTAYHDSELSSILQQTHSAMVMRALPQELYDTDRTVVGEVRYQEEAPWPGLARRLDPNSITPAPAPAVPPAGTTKDALEAKLRRATDKRGKGKPAPSKGRKRKKLSYPPAVRYPDKARSDGRSRRKPR